MFRRSPFALTTAVTISVLLILSRGALAWHGPGHEITAAIAYYELGPRRAHQVAELLKHSPQYAEWMSARPAGIPEDEYLFMRASTWADDIRSERSAGHEYSRPSWHYMDRWYSPSGAPAPPDEPGEHILRAVERNEQVARDSSDDSRRAMAVCWLFHLYGDVEMPLHTTSLVSSQYPRGDAGGNRFWVTTSEGAMNLHSFWDGLWDRDAAVDHGEGRRVWQLRESDMDLTKIDAIARRIAREHPRRAIVREFPATAFADVAAEGYALTTRHVYLNGTLKGGENRDDAPPVPPGYEASAKALGEKRLAAGGYRLAAELRSLLKP